MASVGGEVGEWKTDGLAARPSTPISLSSHTPSNPIIHIRSCEHSRIIALPGSPKYHLTLIHRYPTSKPLLETANVPASPLLSPLHHSAVHLPLHRDVTGHNSSEPA